MTTVDNIVQGLGVTELRPYEKTGLELQLHLNKAINNLQRANSIVDGKVSIDFLLGISGAYEVGLQTGQLTNADDPSEMYETDVLPYLDEIQARTEELK